MCRLVTEAEDVAPFIPMLLPALKRAADETADLEAAGEAKSAVDALVKALGVGHVADRAKAGLSGACSEPVVRYLLWCILLVLSFHLHADLRQETSLIFFSVLFILFTFRFQEGHLG